MATLTVVTFARAQGPTQPLDAPRAEPVPPASSPMALAQSPSTDQDSAAPWWHEEESASIDPLLVVGLSFVPASAVAIGLGTVQLEGERYETCDASGCGERIRDPETAFSPAMLTMGATAGLFAVTTIAVGAWNTSQGKATAPLGVAGSWMLGNGLSTLGMGAVMLGFGNDGDGAAGIIAVAGALSTAAGGGLLLVNASVDHEGYEPASVGKLSTGIALATTAAASATPMALLCAKSTESSGSFIGAGFALYCLPTFLGTLGVATTGAVLWGLGAASGEEDAVAFDVGPNGVHIKGRW